jgi:hypothetical protein
MEESVGQVYLQGWGKHIVVCNQYNDMLSPNFECKRLLRRLTPESLLKLIQILDFFKRSGGYLVL